MSDCDPKVVVHPVIRPLTVTHPVKPLRVTRQQTTTQVTQRTTRLEVEPQVRDVIVEQPVARITKVTTPGPQGPQGPPSDGIQAIPFAYGDAPSVVATAPGDGIITIVRVAIETAFDGVGATITVGVLGNTDALMTAAQNEPSEAASYEDVADYPVTAGTAIWLEINGGTGATQGAGVLFVGFTPEA